MKPNPDYYHNPYQSICYPFVNKNKYIVLILSMETKFISTSLPLFSFAPGDGDEPRGSSKKFIDNKDPELLVPRNHALI
jgi:hypothetical protein